MDKENRHRSVRSLNSLRCYQYVEEQNKKTLSEFSIDMINMDKSSLGFVQPQLELLLVRLGRGQGVLELLLPLLVLGRHLHSLDLVPLFQVAPLDVLLGTVAHEGRPRESLAPQASQLLLELLVLAAQRLDLGLGMVAQLRIIKERELRSDNWLN